MRLKLPPVGVVPPAHRDEPLSLGRARNDRPRGAAALGRFGSSPASRALPPSQVASTKQVLGVTSGEKERRRDPLPLRLMFLPARSPTPSDVSRETSSLSLKATHRYLEERRTRMCRTWRKSDTLERRPGLSIAWSWAITARRGAGSRGWVAFVGQQRLRNESIGSSRRRSVRLEQAASQGRSERRLRVAVGLR
jgi:hypothetical protein